MSVQRRARSPNPRTRVAGIPSVQDYMSNQRLHGYRTFGVDRATAEEVREADIWTKYIKEGVHVERSPADIARDMAMNAQRDREWNAYLEQLDQRRARRNQWETLKYGIAAVGAAVTVGLGLSYWNSTPHDLASKAVDNMHPDTRKAQQIRSELLD